MEDRADLAKVIPGKTRVVLTKDLSIMNPNLVEGATGLVIGSLATYTLKVSFPAVTVGVNWKDLEIVPGKTGMPTLAEQPKAIPRPKGADVE